MTLRTMIADDEPLARERLKMLLAPDPDIYIAAECRNGSEVVKSLKAAKTDLLFLDIQMPGRDGFEVIQEIGPANMPITVFVTAHNEHAVNAFEVHALDYLVKPIERTRLEQTLARVKERVQLEEAFAAREQISSAVEALRRVAHPERAQRFLTRSGNTASFVSVSDIEWIEAADYYVCLHAGGKRHLLRESIRALETKLDPKTFIRLHRSAIVNLDHVREIHRDGQAEGWVLLSTGARVRLNRNGWRKLIGATGASKNPVL
ncbi:MAG: LytR/AlgR family response regulator transcription factor [Terracidiphilus sp.]|nr:LytTR family DNA-binding domain-containing protein [Candidatus Sulfotelmatobacter sp.]